MTPRIPPEDTFVAAIYLTPVARHELYSHGRRVISQGYGRGSLRIVNLLDEYAANILEPHEAATFYIPRAAFDEISLEAGTPRIGDLRCEPGTPDAVLSGLMQAAGPALDRPSEVSRLFLDHVAQAACIHLAHRYGGVSERWPFGRGALSADQLRRATDTMADRFADNPSLDGIAREVGLSRGHFARAFRIATGVTPYRWLLRYRVERARHLLTGTTLPVAQIAMACGFADQSHLTRVFTHHIGLAPAAWRRRARP